MYKKLDPEKVLAVVKRLGPCVPNEVRRELGLSDSIIVGATLSELLRAGKLVTTTVRKGSSSLYYDPSNKAVLEKASQYLNEKDIRTYNLLKDKKVLRDDEVEPLIRVSLRNIKDFSKKLSITFKDQELVFWRYFLVSQDEAIAIIKESLGVSKKKVEKKEELVEDNSKILHKEIIEEVKEKTISKPKKEIQKRLEEKEIQKDEKQSRKKLVEINDDFYNGIRNYFDKNNIQIVEQKLIRKNSELDFIILMPTPLGDVKYFCKAKSKKKSNDGDLASAKMQGLSQNLPTAYLTTGEITKKAKNMLDNELKGIVVKEL